MLLNCRSFLMIRTPDVNRVEEATKLCSKGSKIYNSAVEYCRKNKDCDSVTLDIQ